ncbi:MAG: efflux transporter outer membrane subunit [Cardiobacteriaceae bacterium]|nr:efflux transporter outer membrane subunit [Cardiobacteriaceae bacterium]
MSHKTHLIPLFIAFALTACQSTNITANSHITLPAAYEQNTAAQGSADISHWWQHWQDPVLNNLITQALEQNLDIAIARSRLNETRATAQLAEADQGAQIGLGANLGHLDANLQNPLSDSSRAALSQNPIGGALANGRIHNHNNILASSLNASWEPDIFGQKRSDADAARYASLGSKEQMHGTQLLIAGNIADNYFKARAIQAQQKNADDTIAILEQLQRYIEARYQAGHTTAYEKTEIQSRLSASKAQRSTLDAQYAAAVRNLAILSGRPPQDYQLPASPRDILKNPPVAPAGQTPQGLIERRPDIRAHAAQIQAYAAKLASAKADLLPRFSLNFLGQGVISLDGENSLKGWADLLSAGIQLPIFTNGRIQANIEAADARLKTALLQYDQTLLQALADVENAYQTTSSLTTQQQLLQEARDSAQQQATDAEKLYRYGDKTLADTLSARLNASQADAALIQNQLAHAQALIGLYKALGGGWTP